MSSLRGGATIARTCLRKRNRASGCRVLTVHTTEETAPTTGAQRAAQCGDHKRYGHELSRGPKGSPDIKPFDRAQALFKQFEALDEALSWARHVEDTGRVPLLIEGHDGTRMDRREIGNALRVGERERIGSPRP
jgi:hypothetical protein